MMNLDTHDEDIDKKEDKRTETKEEWKTAAEPFGSRGVQVSNLGRVRNVQTLTYYMPKHNENEYVSVAISMGKKNTHKHVFVHKLVMETFVGKRPKGLQIDHINRIRGDNQLSNLRYTTKAENAKNKKGRVAREKVVVLINKDGEIVKRWDSEKFAANEYKRSLRTIRHFLKTKRIVNNGHIMYFEYAMPMKNEEWREITIRDTKLFASSYGRIRKDDKILYGHIQGGYRRVTIVFNGQTTKAVQVHRLVAFAFHPIANFFDENLVADHINEDKLDNRACNLQWITHSENSQKSWLVTKANRKARAKVIQYDATGKFLKAYSSVHESSDDLKLTESTIASACRQLSIVNKRWQFRYCYEDIVSKIDLEEFDKLQQTKKLGSHRLLTVFDKDEKFTQHITILQLSIEEKCTINTVTTYVDTNRIFKSKYTFRNAYDKFYTEVACDMTSMSLKQYDALFKIDVKEYGNKSGKQKDPTTSEPPNKKRRIS